MSSGYLLIFALAIIILITAILTSRSNRFAEDLRKTKIINELPVHKSDVNKLFKKKNSSKKRKRSTYGYSKINFDEFEEVSPLKILGYSVGDRGLNEVERHRILNLSVFGDFQPYIDSRINYDSRWGSPGSLARFNAVHNHIRRVKNLRTNRSNMSRATRDWTDDLLYIHQQRHELYRFRLIQPRQYSSSALL
jgi:hypothetical protein